MPGLSVLRIPEGLSSEHPRFGQRYQYELVHRAIYRQLREAAGEHRLIIDLHAGEDDAGPCADVICADRQFLSCTHRWATPGASSGIDVVRAVQLTADGRAVAQDSTAARTVIPSCVWDSREFLFVGLEIYLPAKGSGRHQDWAFAAELVEKTIGCARSIGFGSPCRA